MELDVTNQCPLSEKEHECMMKEGICFYCREGKHLAWDCPKKGKKPTKLLTLETEEPDVTKSGKDESS